MRTNDEAGRAAADLIGSHGAERALEIACRRASALELNPHDAAARMWSVVARRIADIAEDDPSPVQQAAA